MKTEYQIKREVVGGLFMFEVTSRRVPTKWWERVFPNPMNIVGNYHGIFKSESEAQKAVEWLKGG